MISNNIVILFVCVFTFHFSSVMFFCATSSLCLYHYRQHLPSPWFGLWVAAVMQTAERSLMIFLEGLFQEIQKNILSPLVWGDGSVQWMSKAWCMTISMRYYMILIHTQTSFFLV